MIFVWRLICWSMIFTLAMTNTSASHRSPYKDCHINLAMADLQEGIGDLELGEGGFEHAALHGLVGCAAAEALDGDCASGAAAGIAQSIYAGLQEGEPDRNDFTSDDAYLASHQMWRNDIAAQTNLLGAAVGYATSSGEAVNVSNAASIARSGAENNYLSHTNLASLRRDLESCDAKEGGCTLAELEGIFLYYQGVSIANDSALGECQTVECVAWHMDQVADFDDLREVTAELAPDLGRDLALDYLKPDLSTERNYLANIAAQTLEDNWKTANCGTLTSVECNVGFKAHLEMLHEQNSRGAATLVLAGAGLAGGARALAACLINPACRAALTATGSVDCAVNPNPLCLAPGPSSTRSTHKGGFASTRADFDEAFPSSGFPSQAHADDAWAAYQSTSSDMRPIAMGRLNATEVADSLGFQRLNVKNWSPEVNAAWVRGGIDARRSFFVASEPNIANYRAAGVFDSSGNFVGRGAFPETVFFTEMRQLRDAGYRLDGNFMRPPAP